MTVSLPKPAPPPPPHPPTDEWNSPANIKIFQLLDQFVAFRNRVFNARICYKNKTLHQQRTRKAKHQVFCFCFSSTAPKSFQHGKRFLPSLLSHNLAASVALVPLWPSVEGLFFLKKSGGKGKKRRKKKRKKIRNSRFVPLPWWCCFSPLILPALRKLKLI